MGARVASFLTVNAWNVASKSLISVVFLVGVEATEGVVDVLALGAASFVGAFLKNEANKAADFLVPCTVVSLNADKDVCTTHLFLLLLRNFLRGVLKNVRALRTECVM